jgi:Ca2+-transporting ATPase
MIDAYQKSVEEIVNSLKTDPRRGLSESQAKERLKKCGPNILPTGKQDTWLSIFISQFQSPLIYILLLAAIIIFFVGERKLDAFIISGILLFNAIIGTIQEGRTSNIVASLRRFLKTKSVVIRDGEHHMIDDQDVVVGDLIVLQEGERIPADARIIQAQRLQVDESILTGESKPVHKTVEPLANIVEIADQSNMVFKGTYITAGSGLAIVIATGTDTYIGKLHASIKDIDTDIPLKKELNRLSYIILIFILALCTVLLIIGLIMGRPFKELLVMLTALFICVIPEGLPVVLTLVLVTGAYRMARQNVLIKNLQGVEALGRTDVIVIDKTGTLTRNEMMVTTVVTQKHEYIVTGEGYFRQGSIMQQGKEIKLDEHPALQELGIACMLLSSAEIFYNKEMRLFDIKGDPTNAALIVLAQKMSYTQEELKKRYKEQYEIPFDSKHKYHAGFFTYENQAIAYIVGAPEVLFEKATSASLPLKNKLQELLDTGLRTVAIGFKKLDPQQIRSDGTEDNRYEYYQKLIENEVTILGLCGIQDAIRPEVSEIIDQARDVGLHIIMATGDHRETAEYVAKKVGIYKPGDLIIEGNQLKNMSDEQLFADLDHITVFARVTPEDKVRIINLFHGQHKVVAMTGDGVNDVPSLVAADLGIAMGRIGTEVAKQAGDLVLLDDSFVNIIRAIEQGRHIFYTLRRIVLYFFATNLGEILIILFALFTQLPLPLLAAQILWLNLVTDGFLDVGLSMEPQEPDLLQAAWLKKKLHLVDVNLLIKTVYLAIPMGVTSLIIFWWTYQKSHSVDYARTMTLITMAMFQWFNAWNCRSERKSLWQIGFLSNKWLIAATLFVLALQFGVVYIPFMQYIFRTVPLSFQDWALIMGVSCPIVLIEEIRKLVARKIGKDT